MKTYYLLTKPGILMGNLFTTLGAFFLGSQGNIEWTVLAAASVGLSGVIASACVINNILDRHADAKMERTKQRPLVINAISLEKAFVFSVVLGLVGFFTLWRFTNEWAFLAAALGFLIYTGLYTFWKYRHSTAVLIGAVSGAMPPVVGYMAAKPVMDLSAFFVFASLVAWQMPHFFSISMHRKDDYKNASIPTFAENAGIWKVKLYSALYIASFLLIATFGLVYGLTSRLHAYSVLLMGTLWMVLSLLGFAAREERTWARAMFFCSLFVILIWSVTLLFF